MNEANQQGRQVRDISWPLLVATSAVIVGSVGFLHYIVIYTEGEVVQVLFTFLVCLTLGSILIGFYRRMIAAWSVVVLGGFLLLWQAYQIRRWAILHEDVIGLVRFAEETKSKSGRYPTNFDAYAFRTKWVKSHIYGFANVTADEFRITYFMNDPGITYWYSSKTGFGYYPD